MSALPLPMSLINISRNTVMLSQQDNELLASDDACTHLCVLNKSQQQTGLHFAELAYKVWNHISQQSQLFLNPAHILQNLIR